MKLSPPGDSSDLDRARAIARRLTAALQPKAAEWRPPAAEPSVPLARQPEPVHDGAPPRPTLPEPEAAPVALDAPPPLEAPPPEPVAVEADHAPSHASADSLVDSLVAEPPAEADPLAALTGGEPAAPEPVAVPAWPDILERCQNVAQAQATLLIDAEGRVVEAFGAWPAAGAEAVAAKLAPMLDKKEQSGSVPSLSVRLAGHILTAWRLSLAGTHATVAFLADVPIGVGVRSAIEDELRTGTL